MSNDTLIKNEGMRILAENLGLVDAERFITLILRELFDYTEWQRELYKGVSVDEFLDNAMDFRLKEKNQ